MFQTSPPGNDHHNSHDTLDPSKKLHPKHSFTAHWLLKSLRENDEKYQILHGDKPVKDITSYDISEGKGFISIVLKCTVIFVDSESEGYSTILKIPGFDSCLQVQNEKTEEIVTNALKQQFASIHQAECAFYNELSDILKAPSPKIYQTQDWILEPHQEGCIHMEDLTLRGRSLEPFDRLNLAQIKSFVRHFARMHKNCLSTDPSLWKGKYLKGQATLAGLLENYKLEYGQFLENCKWKDQFKPLLGKYANFMSNKDYYLFIQTESYKALNLQPIIVHGDISFGNIMFGLNESGEIQNEIVAIIDWQLMHEGSPMEDLAKLLVHFADGNVRRKAEPIILEYYLECLGKEFGDDQKVPYTLEQIKKAYSYCFISQTFFVVMGIVQKVVATDGKNGIEKAFHDSEVLKCLHALEDADQILQGELKEFFDKFNS